MRVAAGCVVGFVIIVIWVLTERVASKPAAVAPRPLLDATQKLQALPSPARSPGGKLAQSEMKSQVAPSEAPAVKVPAAEVPAAAKIEERARSTPYEILMSNMDKQDSQIASMVLYQRNKILSSQDDPEWARPMEKALFAYVMQVTASDSTTVDSITCRSAGCELQLSHALGSQSARRVFLGLRERFPSLKLALDMPSTAGGRILQLTYLTRVKKEGE